MDTTKIAEKIANSYAAGTVPDAIKDDKFTKNDPDNPNPKGNDRDGDGKTNEAKPFKSGDVQDVPKGVVASLDFEGNIRVYSADDAEAAHGIKTALMEDEGKYASIIHGPNSEGMTASELYQHFQDRWTDRMAGKIPPQFLENIKKKKDEAKGKDGDDDKKDKDDKKPDFLKKKEDK